MHYFRCFDFGLPSTDGVLHISADPILIGGSLSSYAETNSYSNLIDHDTWFEASAAGFGQLIYGDYHVECP